MKTIQLIPSSESRSAFVAQLFPYQPICFLGEADFQTRFDTLGIDWRAFRKKVLTAQAGRESLIQLSDTDAITLFSGAPGAFNGSS